MNIYVPYTYYLYHFPTQSHYYGVRFSKTKRHGIANPADLWVTYFTSSKRVKKLREQYGDDSFHVEVRRTFDNSKSALAWETKVLRRLKVKQRTEWLNQTANELPTMVGQEHPMFGKQHSEEAKTKMKGRIVSDRTRQLLYNSSSKRRHSEETKALISINNIGKCRGKDKTSFKGYWVTPWGTFDSSRDASKQSPSGVSRTTIRRRCQNDSDGFSFIPT